MTAESIAQAGIIKQVPHRTEEDTAATLPNSEQNLLPNLTPRSPFHFYRDNIIQFPNAVNPNLPPSEGVVIFDKPPGYLSKGDMDVLQRYTQAYKEPPMGFHDSASCPNCKR